MEVSMTMRFTPVCVGVLSIGITALVPAFVAAQTPVQSLSGMPSFASAVSGKSVKITADGVQREGHVTSLSTTGLVLVEDGVPVSIPFDRIVRVEKSTHHLRK